MNCQELWPSRYFPSKSSSSEHKSQSSDCAEISEPTNAMAFETKSLVPGCFKIPHIAKNAMIERMDA